jgi:hypothetical protein
MDLAALSATTGIHGIARDYLARQVRSFECVPFQVPPGSSNAGDNNFPESVTARLARKASPQNRP